MSRSSSSNQINFYILSLTRSPLTQAACQRNTSPSQPDSHSSRPLRVFCRGSRPPRVLRPDHCKRNLRLPHLLQCRIWSFVILFSYPFAPFAPMGPYLVPQLSFLNTLKLHIAYSRTSNHPGLGSNQLPEQFY